MGTLQPWPTLLTSALMVRAFCIDNFSATSQILLGVAEVRINLILEPPSHPIKYSLTLFKTKLGHDFTPVATAHPRSPPPSSSATAFNDREDLAKANPDPTLNP